MFLGIIQGILAALLIALVLLQSKGTGLSSIFGNEGGFYRTKRGFEKFLYYFTIITASLFTIVSLLRIV